MTPRKEPLSKRYKKLEKLAKGMAAEYDRVCSVMSSHFGCDDCPLNVEGLDGGGCYWYEQFYTPMVEMGLLDE